MSLEVAYPKAFFGLLLLIPAMLFTFSRYTTTIKVLADHNNVYRSEESFRRFRLRFMLRTIFRGLAWVMLILAIAGISWGTRAVTVQKSGTSVAMVFDISYSMEARDTPDRETRLQTAAEYAERLLDRMEGSSVSVTLAKGNASCVIPMTEDFESIKTLLSALSPKLMESEGSSLGSGIEAAMNSFPSQSAAFSTIWLFTDGEETDGQFSQALNKAARNAIPVTIIGIGDSSRTTTAVAGDGITKVSTALREDKIKAAMESVTRKTTGSAANNTIPSVTYLNYSQAGSAVRLLNSLNMKANSSSDQATIAYEIQSVKRTNLFIIFAIIFFVLSVFFGEFDAGGRKRMLRNSAFSLIAVMMMFTGCSKRFANGVDLLNGRVSWSRANYSSAISRYITLDQEGELTDDQLIMDYATFGLATTYLMQDESDAALKKYAQISDKAPDSIKFGVLYNSGIIAHRRGDYEEAAEYFKQALLINSSSQAAKINLELSLEENSLRKNSQEKESLEEKTVSQDSKSGADYENSLYSLIRENELNQWKNRQQQEAGSAEDF